MSTENIKTETDSSPKPPTVDVGSLARGSALSMASAPTDGSRILLHYYVRQYNHGQWPRVGDKWEECRWVSDDKEQTGSNPHWEPWCGNERTRTTEHIQPTDAIEWASLPNQRLYDPAHE